MTKGQFAALATALGLATMAGSGYIAYATSGAHGQQGTHSGAAASAAGSGGGGGGPQPSQGSTIEIPTVSASQGTGTAAAGAVRECGNEDVRVTSTANQGAAGHISLTLVFTNFSAHPCVLHGYPGASLLDAGGNDLLDAQRTLSGYSGGAVGLSAPPKVVLKPKESASAVLEWTDVTSGSGANNGCAVPKPATLAVTPPNTTRTTTLPMNGEVCGEFQIHPVLKGVATTP